jgi:hypothetical protein
MNIFFGTGLQKEDDIQGFEIIPFRYIRPPSGILRHFYILKLLSATDVRSSESQLKWKALWEHVYIITS